MVSAARKASGPKGEGVKESGEESAGELHNLHFSSNIADLIRSGRVIW
jgi:hypothetical protein